MKYDFTQRITKGEYDIQVDPAAKYGYFEHETLGEDSGGGLWFEVEWGVMSLVDYDGVYELPKPVAEALRELGYFVDPEIFD